MTEQERMIVMKLATVWDDVLELPVQHRDDIDETRRLIHALQDKIAARPAWRDLNG